MNAQLKNLHQAIYKQNKLFGVSKPLKDNPFAPKNKRNNSIVLVGGAFGDEGKGRVTDEVVNLLLKSSKKAIEYRDNGGSNAGHTIQVGNTKIALHQIGSGILLKGCTVISGKGMIIHPQDLMDELKMVQKAVGGSIPATYLIDEMAVLSLDTHRALENVIKTRMTGSKGSTGRGVAPAYADIIYRHPIRVRDLYKTDWKNIFTGHYQFYNNLIKGLGGDLSKTKVAHLHEEMVVGTLPSFLKNLEGARKFIKSFVADTAPFLAKSWSSSTPFVFEKAQALGLDVRYGVYPDVTASDCTPDGIRGSTEGIVEPGDIAVKAAVIKATYSSSVGTRIMPSSNHHLTEKIREDANEYGATTKRPRDIHYLDIPFLSYLMRVGGIEYLCPTHLDISYPGEPIKVCVAYKKNGKEVPYRPDQEYLLTVKPEFIELPEWDGKALGECKKPSDLPKACLRFLAFLSQTLNVKLLMATTGPKRHQTISWY